MNLHALCEGLPLENEPRILKPDWYNPLLPEHGTGIELTVSCTLDELLCTHRSALFALTHIGQFCNVRCKKDERKLAKEHSIYLNADRPATDYLWHADANHNAHKSVTVLHGNSPIPTGVLAKPQAAAMLQSTLEGEESSTIVDSIGSAQRSYLDQERNGKTKLWSGATQLGIESSFRCLSSSRPEVFWQFIERTHQDSNIYWHGNQESQYDEALCLSPGVYHVKGASDDVFDTMHRQRGRLELRPSDSLQLALTDRLGDVTFDEDSQLAVDTQRQWAQTELVTIMTV